MSIKDKEKWDRRYNCKKYVYGKDSSLFLRQKINILTEGDALVLAMGEGRNAVYVAKMSRSLQSGNALNSRRKRKCTSLEL